MSYELVLIEKKEHFKSNDWEIEFISKYANHLFKIDNEDEDIEVLDDNGELLTNAISEFYKNENPTLKDIFEIHFLYRYMVFRTDTAEKCYEEFLNFLT